MDIQTPIPMYENSKLEILTTIEQKLRDAFVTDDISKIKKWIDIQDVVSKYLENKNNNYILTNEDGVNMVHIIDPPTIGD